MKQRQREQVQRGCAVGTVVLLAWLCRVLPLEGLPSGLREACGILRSLLYLSLFAGWGISLYNRTVHPQVRRLAGRPDAGRRHGAVCSGILDGAQAQGHVLQVPALNPNPQRPRANAPLTLWAMHHISL